MLALMAGCTSGPGPVVGVPAVDPAGRPVVLVGTERVTWDELRPVLSEAGGGVAQHGPQFIPGDALRADQHDRERATLVAALAGNGGDPDVGESMLAIVRRSRGLGEVRFAALLRRNAMLRALVAPSVKVTDTMVAQAHQIRHGPRYRVRVIVVESQADAEAARRQVMDRGGGSPVFTAVAAERSVDESSARGGLLDPISDADPATSAALRQAVSKTTPGSMTPIIPLNPGFALALVEAKLPADGRSLDETRAALTAEVRSVQERAAMERLARQLLASAQISVLDRPLHWAWENRTGQGASPR
jgi:hypothetical protein